MTNEALTINGNQAAVLYAALEKAVEVVEQLATRSSARQFKGALAIELSAYKHEQARLAAAFPTLTDTGNAAA